MRSLLVLFASSSGYLIILEVLGDSRHAYLGLISGVLIALMAIKFEERVRRAPLKIVIGGAFGLIVGLVVANLLTYPLVLNFLDNRYVEVIAYLLTNSVIGYMGLSIGMKKGDEFEGFDRLFSSLIKGDEGRTRSRDKGTILIDTSVIIDGRIAAVAETGFIEGTLSVPRFVLEELQWIADSPDAIKRARGKRGLDILKELQRSEKVKTVLTDEDAPGVKEVDGKLIELARKMGSSVLTNDSNLHKVAELHGVKVLNMNTLAASLKPAVMPGELITITVVKEGKEPGQGIGYLDDGTMVVIDNAREHVGYSVDASITSILQTSGGRMVFSRAKEDSRKPPLSLTPA